MQIHTWRDPYDTGVSFTKPKDIEFHPGVTVLVGCNGAGKSTLLHNIKSECEGRIPCHLFDNLSSGGNTSLIQEMLSGVSPDIEGDSWAQGVEMLNSSEGEAIKQNIIRQSRLYDTFLTDGHFKDRHFRMVSIFHEQASLDTKDRVLLFDATDSGLSIDSVCELKLLFSAVLSKANELGLNLYIIIAANEYELCRESDCFDVRAGKYITFDTYDSYRKFILKSREYKDRRLVKQHEYINSQYQLELSRFHAMADLLQPELDALRAKCESNPNYVPNWSERDILAGRKLRDFVRGSRYLDEEEFQHIWEKMMNSK